MIFLIWIGIHLLEVGATEVRRKAEFLVSRVRQKWIVTHDIYILMLLLYDFGAIVTVGIWEERFDITTWSFFTIMLLVLAYDFVFSKGFDLTKAQA